MKLNDENEKKIADFARCAIPRRDMIRDLVSARLRLGKEKYGPRRVHTQRYEDMGHAKRLVDGDGGRGVRGRAATLPPTTFGNTSARASRMTMNAFSSLF